MAEGARKFERNPHDAQEPKGLDAPDIDVALGDIAVRLFDLQAERARLEGEGASAAELKHINDEIAPLQAYVEENEEAYRRMEIQREESRVVRMPEKKAKKVETGRDLGAELTDLQKRYDLTAEQLANETDPEARAALENGVDSLRQRIHALKADMPWAKEDRALEKGGITRSSAAREKARTAAETDYLNAELQRAVLNDMREEYASSLEAGGLPKSGESMLRGAVQTLDDALTRYGRGDLSVEDFEKRGTEIKKARKAWDSYVTGETAEAARIKDIERRGKESRARLEATMRRREEQAEQETRAATAAEAQKKAEAEKAPFRERAEANGVKYTVGWVGGREQRYEAYFPQIDRNSPEADKYRIHDQIFIIDSKDKARAKEIFDKIGDILKKEKNPYRAFAKAEAFERGEAWEEPGAREFRDMVEKAKAKRDASRAEVRGILEGLAKEREEYEQNKDRQAASDLIGAMEAGPDTNVPENLPVAPEAKAGAAPNEYTRNIFTRIEEGKQRAAAKAKAERAAAKPKQFTEAQEEHWFAQGENPEELARRQEMLERYEGITPSEAEEIVSQSEQVAQNKDAFVERFVAAASQYPGEKPFGDPQAYAEKYWALLQNENKRLADALAPPKKSFFGNVKKFFGFGGTGQSKVDAQKLKDFQIMDKTVRDILERPGTSMRGAALRGSSGRSNTSGYIGIGRTPPR